MNVLVTFAGGSGAVGVIKSLRNSDLDCKIFAVDNNPLSAGLFLADGYAVVPPYNHINFITDLKKIISENNIDVILPTGEEDLPILLANQDTLGAQLIMSDLETINICNNKMDFYEFISPFVTCPKTTLNSTELNKPFISKPNSGRGSRNVVLHQINYTPNEDEILQEFIEGTEYTVDVLCLTAGNIDVAIPRIRTEIKSGVSTKGEIVTHTEIEEVCKIICDKLNIVGVANIQFIEKNGKIYLIEVNPRFGGGTYMSTLAGVNLPELLIRHHLNMPCEIPKPKQIKVVRYFEEIVV